MNIGSGTAEEQLTIRNTTQHCLVRIISANNSSAGVDFGDPEDTDIGRVRYYHSDGSNTNYMRFDTNGGEKLRITSTGRVGINETSPDGQLHIKDTNPSIYLEGTNGSGRQHKIWSAGTNSESLQLSSGNLLYNGDVHYFRASNESTEYARITSGGKLLVGANSATNGSIAEFSKSVAGGGAGCHITVENTSTNSVNNTAGIHLKTDTGTAKFFKYRAAQTFLQSAAGGASELLLQANGAHPMRLYAGDAERVRIDDTG